MNHRPFTKRICLFIVICMLFLGMCPTGSWADSFFASVRTSSHAVRELTGTVITSVGDNLYRQPEYTRETFPSNETALTPQQSIRRVSTRMQRGFYTLLSAAALTPQFFFSQSDAYISHIHDEIIGVIIIINYIHKQDGEKA